MKMKNNHYYAKRLLSQALCDPRVDVLDSNEMEEYISAEAEKLCVPVDAVTDTAMREYNLLTETRLESERMV